MVLIGPNGQEWRCAGQVLRTDDLTDSAARMREKLVRLKCPFPINSGVLHTPRHPARLWHPCAAEPWLHDHARVRLMAVVVCVARLRNPEVAQNATSDAVEVHHCAQARVSPQ